MNERRRANGYTDLGPVRVPPLPPKPALTDRSNGLIYEITKSGSVPALSQITNTAGYNVHAAFSGPYVQAGAETRRLFASGGTLGSELLTFVAGTAPPMVIVSTAPLDVWEVVWDTTTEALSLTERI